MSSFEVSMQFAIDLGYTYAFIMSSAIGPPIEINTNPSSMGSDTRTKSREALYFERGEYLMIKHALNLRLFCSKIVRARMV